MFEQGLERIIPEINLKQNPPQKPTNQSGKFYQTNIKTQTNLLRLIVITHCNILLLYIRKKHNLYRMKSIKLPDNVSTIRLRQSCWVIFIRLISIKSSIVIGLHCIDLLSKLIESKLARDINPKKTLTLPTLTESANNNNQTV